MVSFRQFRNNRNYGYSDIFLMRAAIKIFNPKNCSLNVFEVSRTGLIKTCFLITAVTLFLGLAALGQDINYLKIGENQFANTEVYTLLYDDSDDVLYIGTNNGLFAHKKNKFQKLKGPKTQVGSSVFDLKKDKNGAVYCNNLYGQVFKIIGNSYQLFYEERLEDTAANFFYSFNQENELLIVQLDKLYRVEKNGTKRLLYQNETIQSHLFSGTMYTGETYIHIGGVGTWKEETIEVNKGIWVVLDNKNRKRVNFLQFDEHLFAIDIDGNARTKNKDVDFPGLYKENFQTLNDSLTLGFATNKGARLISGDENALRVVKTFLPNSFVSCGTMNKEGTLFLGSFGEGVIVVPNYQTDVFELKNELLLGITTSPTNDVFWSTLSGNIYRLKENDTLLLIDAVGSNVDNLFYATDFSDSDTSILKQLIYPFKKNSSVVDQFPALKEVNRISENIHLCTFSHQISVLLKDSLSCPFFVDPNTLGYNKFLLWHLTIANLERFRSSTWSSGDSLFYYSTGQGVFSKEWVTGVKDSLLHNGALFLANDLETHNDVIICATQDKGLLFYQNHELLQQLDIAKGLLSNNVIKIKYQGDILYLLTDAGIQVYDLKNEQWLGLGVSEGLIRQSATNFAVSSNKLWLLEKHRVYAIPLSQLFTEDSMGELYVDSVLVSGVKLSDYSQQTFAYNQNQINFHFDYRDAETKSETVFYYRLEGLYNEWQQVPADQYSIEFPFLPAGNYNFQLKAAYRSLETETFSYPFRVALPYWQRWWFYLLIGFAVAFLIGGLAFYRIQFLRKKAAKELRERTLEKNVIDAQLRAIRAQMNPHFIFNSINSIQDLVLQKDAIRSYDYLVLFSQLVRNTLEYSEKEFITLSEELQFLTVYLKLEKLRFKEDFEYEITSNCDETILVPTLIVQPFVENAIKHGLLHKSGIKKLSVHFEFGNELICTIEDNGVGRAVAMEIKKRQNVSHQSFSTGAIAKRLQMLEEQIGVKSNYETIDLKDEDGNALGTKVILHLPTK